MHTYLAKWRAFRKLGQKQLAAVADVSVQTISNIESERGGFTSEMIVRLAGSLRCTPQELIAVDPTKHRSIFARTMIRNDVVHGLRLTSAIMSELADLIQDHPDRVRIARVAVQRLSGQTRRR